MTTLYSLAYLMAADHEAAEACFVAALDDCQHEGGVLREWAGSWSRRAIIKHAINQLRPRPGDAQNAPEAAHEQKEIATLPQSLLQLPPFERFAFAMTALERYSTRESALLLDCQARDVEQAKIRALQFIGIHQDRLAAAFAGSHEQQAPITGLACNV